MSIIIKKRILAQANYVLEKAVALYPLIPDLRRVEIKTDLRGEKAGQAVGKFGAYSARFNMEYAVAHLQHVLFEIVPHEIAHIVRFIEADDNSHGNGWKDTCKKLGGNPTTLHSMPMIFCKGRTFEYTTTNGFAVRVSEHMHNKVQAGAAYRYSVEEGIINRHCNFIVVV